MFNMPRHAGTGGYELRISYFPHNRTFRVTGYRFELKDNQRMEIDRDGHPLVFDSMDRAIDYIVNYEEDFNACTMRPLK